MNFEPYLQLLWVLQKMWDTHFHPLQAFWQWVLRCFFLAIFFLLILLIVKYSSLYMVLNDYDKKWIICVKLIYSEIIFVNFSEVLHGNSSGWCQVLWNLLRNWWGREAMSSDMNSDCCDALNLTGTRFTQTKSWGCFLVEIIVLAQQLRLLVLTLASHTGADFRHHCFVSDPAPC